MTISAKFPSRCACCGGNIRVGEQIEWTKGSPAVHAGCVGKPIAAAAPKAPRAPKAAAPKVDTTGCQYLSRRSTGRDDGYDVGQVLHAPKIAGGGGDGHYWTVVKVERKWKDDDTDEWMVACYARPSIPEEFEGPLARRTAKANHEALVKELESLARAGTNYSDAEAIKPTDGREVVINLGAHGSGKIVAVLSEDGAVSVWCSGFYDDYRQSLQVTRSARAVEIMGLLLGV